MKLSVKLFCSVIALVLISAGAFGVLRDQNFERERRDAVYHAQLQILKIAVPAAVC
jgi:hypothetical protein